jgi:chitin synthase-like protein
MDDFGWGNTRLVIGEGSSKKVMINEDEKFDESMIPLKKFSGKACILDELNHLTLPCRVRSRSLGNWLTSFRRELSHWAVQASITHTIRERLTSQLSASVAVRRLLSRYERDVDPQPPQPAIS